jgi:hypothetical protein
MKALPRQTTHTWNMINNKFTLWKEHSWTEFKTDAQRRHISYKKDNTSLCFWSPLRSLLPFQLLVHWCLSNQLPTCEIEHYILTTTGARLDFQIHVLVFRFTSDSYRRTGRLGCLPTSTFSATFAAVPTEQHAVLVHTRTRPVWAWRGLRPPSSRFASSLLRILGSCMWIVRLRPLGALC